VLLGSGIFSRFLRQRLTPRIPAESPKRFASACIRLLSPQRQTNPIAPLFRTRLAPQMLPHPRSFIHPASYAPSIVHRSHRFSPSPLPRSLRLAPSKSRSYATSRPEAGANGAGGTGGLPLGQINLGAGKTTQKGVAIKDDITKSWRELSVPQKIVRTGTQTTNFAVVVVAVGVLVSIPGLYSLLPGPACRGILDLGFLIDEVSVGACVRGLTCCRE